MKIALTIEEQGIYDCGYDEGYEDGYREAKRELQQKMDDLAKATKDLREVYDEILDA